MSEQFLYLDFDEIERQSELIKDLVIPEISDQNSRYAAVQTEFEGQPFFKELAETGIAEEQTSSITDLMEVAANVPYEAIGMTGLQLQHEADESLSQITALGQQVSDLEAVMEAEQSSYIAGEAAKYETMLENMGKLSPRKLEEARQYVNVLLQDLPENPGAAVHKKQLEELRNKITLRTSEYDETVKKIDRLNSLTVASAWPVPKAIEMSVEAAQENIGIVIDQLPVDPKLNRQARTLYAAMRERHIDQPEASLYAAVYLGEHQSEVVSVQDLITFLYPENVLESMSEYHLRARVTTLLGPQSGILVKSLLQEEGFVLQYGWRNLMKANGDGKLVISNRTRIYRALPADSVNASSYDPIEENGVSIQFDQLPPVVGQVEQSNTASSTDPAAVALQGVTRAVGRTKTERSATPQWQRELKVKIGEAINELEQWGVLSEEPRVVRLVKRQAQSSKFGTEEAVRRLREAGIVSGLSGVRNDRLINQSLTAAEFVMMHLFNTTKELQAGPRQRQAIKLVEDAIASYWRHKREG